MIFTTFWFVLFATGFLLVFFAWPFAKGRSVLLAAASALFYAHFAGPAGMVPILVLGAVTYALGLTRRPSLLNLGMVLCAASLIFYKYTAFLSANLVELVPALKAYPVSQYVPVVAPLAISFFVFEFVHYLYDVKKGNPAIRNPLDFFHFAMFFPTLVAGPIKRYEQFLPALKQGLASASIASPGFQAGLLRVLVGFGKKFVADSLALYVTTLGPAFESHPLELRWMIFTALAMRIYLDFSGYSDMAIGFARMVGIRIPENFNWPYLATSVRDFWHRWHISLSTWIRDYLYVPLGGNRVRPARQALNALTVFVVCGLWHGAAWNFVLWGTYHGLGLVLQHAMARPLAGMQASLAAKVPASLPFGVQLSRGLVCLPAWAVTTLFVWSGWLLFFYPPGQALKMFVALFRP